MVSSPGNWPILVIARPLKLVQGDFQLGIDGAVAAHMMLRRLLDALGIVPRRAGKLRSGPGVRLRLGNGAPGKPLPWTINPRFLEWLMGWPIGWSDARSSATGWCRWLQRMRGALSELPLSQAISPGSIACRRSRRGSRRLV
jgi:hypothetical protein